MNIKEAIAEVVERKDLTEQQMFAVMNQILSGDATEAQIGSFITALRMKGETVEEITGAVKVMREKVTAIEITGDTDEEKIVVDTCGTGGDGAGTFNVSTAAALVVAGAGVIVAKHGNRAASSKCGSADVLEALGVAVDLAPEKVADCIQKIGIGFLYAPLLHGAMKYAAAPRRELGVRTIFNILGPLTNPAAANVQLLGVFDGDLTETLAKVLGRLGSKRALVVHGEGHLDEMTVTGATRVSEYNEGNVVTYSIKPEELGLNRSQLKEIKGGETAKESAAQFRSVLQGEKGAKRDMVLLNASGALYAAGKTSSLQDGIVLAAEIIDSGKANEKLEELIRVTSELHQR